MAPVSSRHSPQYVPPPILLPLTRLNTAGPSTCKSQGKGQRGQQSDKCERLGPLLDACIGSLEFETQHMIACLLSGMIHDIDKEQQSRSSAACGGIGIPAMAKCIVLMMRRLGICTSIHTPTTVAPAEVRQQGTGVGSHRSKDRRLKPSLVSPSFLYQKHLLKNTWRNIVCTTTITSSQALRMPHLDDGNPRP